MLGTTPYAQFVRARSRSGSRTRTTASRPKWTDGLGDAVAVVVPLEASAAAPYGISLVEKGPNPNAGKLWLNLIMTEFGQGIFAQGFVRPSVPGVKLPDNVADKLPAPQVRPLDVKPPRRRRPTSTRAGRRRPRFVDASRRRRVSRAHPGRSRHRRAGSISRSAAGGCGGRRLRAARQRPVASCVFEGFRPFGR